MIRNNKYDEAAYLCRIVARATETIIDDAMQSISPRSYPSVTVNYFDDRFDLVVDLREEGVSSPLRILHSIDPNSLLHTIPLHSVSRQIADKFLGQFDAVEGE